MRAETNQSLEPDYDPNAGGVGFLTFDEFERLTKAVSNARSHVAWWRIAGHIRLGDPEEHQTRSSDPTLPLPATWLAAEEIGNLLVEMQKWRTLEDAASHGPEIAMQLVREVETAMAKWPMSDRAHKVRYLRCRACQQQTLKYFPPRLTGPSNAQMTTVQVRVGREFHALDVLDVNVKCTNKECRAVEDPAMFERDALLIKLEAERAAGKRLDSAGRSAAKSRPLTFDHLPVGVGGQGADDQTETEAVAVHP